MPLAGFLPDSCRICRLRLAAVSPCPGQAGSCARDGICTCEALYPEKGEVTFVFVGNDIDQVDYENYH